ncbi:MAG: hypothetical protein JRI25_08845 [Deltaproteobacteria bacterium]|nr:hypothetical protein [Deltaproteobacteria bacterium]
MTYNYFIHGCALLAVVAFAGPDLAHAQEKNQQPAEPEAPAPPADVPETEAPAPPADVPETVAPAPEPARSPPPPPVREVVAPVEVVLGGDEDPTVYIPVGVPTELRLRHVRGGTSEYAGRGGPPGMVVHSDGEVTYTASEDHAGREWAVTIRYGTSRSNFRVVVVHGPPEGPSTVLVEQGMELALGAVPIETQAEPGERSARGPMMVYGAVLGGWVGATAGYAIGDAAGDTESQSQGATMGSMLGSGVGLGTTALILKLRSDYEPTWDQVVLMSSTSAIGAWTGMSAAMALIPVGAEDGGRRIALSGSLGAIAGAGLGMALEAPPPVVMGNIDLGVLIGWQAAAGASDMAGWTFPNDRRPRAGLALAGGYAVGFTAGVLRALDVPGPSPGLLGVGLAEGAWIGAWSPLLVTRDPDPRQVFGGLRLGMGAGYLLSQALAPIGALDGRVVALQSVGFASGTALGAGLPLAMGVEPNDSDAATRAVVAPMLAGGLVGIFTGAVVAPHYDLSTNDIALLSTLEVWSVYQAIGWGFFGGHVSDSGTVPLGYALTAAGAGTLFAMALAPAIDVNPAESILIASAGGWGTWYGAWIGHLVGMDPEYHWLLALGTGNIALIGTAAVAAGPAEADWADVAYIDGLTALGGATGALVGIIASPDFDTVALAGLVGTTLGFAGGMYLATRPGASPTSLALPLPHLRVRTPFRARVQARPWLDEEGKAGVWVDLHLVER